MKSSACRTVATSVLWAKSRMRRMMPHSTNICVTARIRIAKMIAPTTLSIPGLNEARGASLRGGDAEDVGGPDGSDQHANERGGNVARK